MENNNTVDRSDIIKKALEEIKRLKKKVAENQTSLFEPIAVVGLACRFPKGANTPAKFWKALQEQKDLIGPVPEKRADHSLGGAWEGSPFLKEAGYLEEDIEDFDHRLFRFSPREAERTDPQQRLFLKVCWEALENAGYAPDSLRGSKTGVYAGIMLMEYMQQLTSERKLTAQFDPYDVSGNGFSFLSGRTSYFFGFQGPGITTDTACSSSLVSIDQACKGLWMDDCKMALAGGVNLLLFQDSTALFSSLNILSPDCRCKSFDAAANGTVRGEGCGVVVLKKLSDALQDGDHIHAVIKATGVNQGGLSSGPTVPHGPSQEMLLKEVWKKAGLSETGPDYIEAHGTGTEIGDPIEMNSIIHLLPKERKTPVFIGTVKSNLGHLEAAAGVAGFIKTVLALENKKIPGNLHFNTPSGHINWSESCIEIPRQTIEWNKSQKPRTAAISSFGLSGTNAHIVLEEYETAITPAQEKTAYPERQWPLRFSARSLSCIRDQWIAFVAFLKENENWSMDQLSYSHNVSRADFKEKQVIWAATKEEALHILETALADESDEVPVKNLWRNSADLPQVTDSSEKSLQEIRFSDTKTNPDLEQDVFADWVKGKKTDWKSYYRGSGLRKINIPNYQFREKVFGLKTIQS
ncbi:beta-ketoacyl synthase N-terminal-like domain-containing protein [Flavobacterium sp. Fl-318]|uniref:Beta-ketoacyl synthase N-terminal-like domain-containing protein n=1 Tax=Flavobacterium cupriresistens TaxID=2893885 RepID=A0ABU4RDE8_9FLAO|nr:MULTISPECIES: polyketide synthase [unclassified Flavobacterium]MDX6189699.1 beta-ketoacyl synthase N-terminal-like domain-containing protein [Flavobacterium sp. Fl-318]UFH40895.1 polyketide synthase [Flavobacterium sp. F-323]